MRWFNRHFMQKEDAVEIVATKFFEPEQLRVFKELPADQVNTKISDSFVPLAPPPAVPQDRAQWEAMRDGWMAKLTAQTFAGWPEEMPRFVGAEAVAAETQDGVTLGAFDIEPQPNVRLRVFMIAREKLPDPELVVLNVLDEGGWDQWLAETGPVFPKTLAGYELKTAAKAGAFGATRKLLLEKKWAMAYVAPRGVGPTEWVHDEKKRVQILRRYPLLGQTADGMRVWDVRAAMRLTRSVWRGVPLWLQGERTSAGIALYASLFERPVARLDLHELPASHATGPYLLNVLRFMDMPAAVAMVAERSRVVIYTADQASWQFPKETAAALGWEKRVEFRDERK
jgi:hypothetical protein